MNIFYGQINREEASLNEADVIHATKVLRKNIGDSIFVTDGQGALAQGKITAISKKEVLVSVDSKTQKDKLNQLHIAIAPTKMNDRFEFFLEKATEIGISEITPIICQRSERKNINSDRCEKILIAAMKQSQNFHLPKFNPPVSFKDFIVSNTNEQKYIAHCEDLPKKQLLSKTKDVVVLIGPEGDFTTEEIALAIENKFIPLTLGNSRLRTETAGIVATTLYNLQ